MQLYAVFNRKTNLFGTLAGFGVSFPGHAALFQTVEQALIFMPKDGDYLIAEVTIDAVPVIITQPEDGEQLHRLVDAA